VLPPSIFTAAAGNPVYLRRFDAVLGEFRRKVGAQVCWFTENIVPTACLPIAYFSLGCGLHRSLPFYAGELGFLAGDRLQECSDLGIPLVAVGVMYPDGYVLQKINADGWQENVDQALDRDAAPITRLVDAQGNQLIVPVPFTEPPIHVGVWQVMVGRIPLYLMDTDLEVNDPVHRKIYNHLYISNVEQRLLQEIVLRIGGSAMLAQMGIKHSVPHMNEGHPAFALLERIRQRVEDNLDYEAVVKEVRATSVFTTHTPVAAGHDVFPFELVDKCICSCYPMLPRDDFLKMGTSPTEPGGAGFNMTAFALRMSEYRNGVSKRHGACGNPCGPSCRRNRSSGYVTNGVHVPPGWTPSWVTAAPGL
jgi:glycogen phosphorylase